MKLQQTLYLVYSLQIVLHHALLYYPLFAQTERDLVRKKADEVQRQSKELYKEHDSLRIAHTQAQQKMVCCVHATSISTMGWLMNENRWIYICPCDTSVYVCVQKEHSKQVMEYEQKIKVLYARAHMYERHVRFVNVD